MCMIKTTYSEKDTEAVGEQLSRKLNPGDCLALYGELGAGKTAFTRGLARGLNCEVDVSSPTFSIINIYPGDIELVHVDLYRIEDNLESIGWDDIFMPDRIIVIEWPEKAKNHLPEKRVDILFSVIDFNTREIEIKLNYDSCN